MSATATVSREELQRLLDEGAPLTLVEALGPMYYEDAHLPGAVNIPHDQVDALAPVVLPDKAGKVVVYCSNTSCQNAAIAARRLVQLGYTDVLEYVEGKQGWVEAGLPVERSTH